MSDLLANPAFQSGVAPFVVALIVAMATLRLGWIWSGLAVMAGFFVTVVLVTDITFSPLTSTRKIILLALVTLAVGLLREILPLKDGVVRPLLAVAAAAAALWVLWPVLARKGGVDAAIMGGGGALYLAWVVAAFDGLNTRRERPVAAAVAFGFGTGGGALLGATAFLGQLGLALGAAAAGLLLVYAFLSGSRPGGWLTVPVSTVGALLGLAAVVYAGMPWVCLLLLAAVPLFARIPLPASLPGWLAAGLITLIAAVPAGGAVAVAWSQAGPPVY